jgi:hypothetical protein
MLSAPQGTSRAFKVALKREWLNEREERRMRGRGGHKQLVRIDSVGAVLMKVLRISIV